MGLKPVRCSLVVMYLLYCACQCLQSRYFAEKEGGGFIVAQ